MKVELQGEKSKEVAKLPKWYETSKLNCKERKHKSVWKNNKRSYQIATTVVQGIKLQDNNVILMEGTVGGGNNAALKLNPKVGHGKRKAIAKEKQPPKIQCGKK